MSEQREPTNQELLQRLTLQPREDQASFALLRQRLQEANIEVTQPTNEEGVVFRSGDDKEVEVLVRVSKPSESQLEISYRGRVKRMPRQFEWKISIDKDDARAFKRFMKQASRTFQPELNNFIGIPGGDEKAADKDPDDELFCTLVGIGVGVANPAGGAAVGAVCLWFASNGLDEEEEEPEDAEE